jgi:mannose-6-phosphate isomerase-like protein (cupin superfamily)/ribosomal protein S27AE
MRKVAIDDVENVPNPLGVHSVRRPVSDALGTENFAMNYLELEPGESFSGGLHAHHDQEEVFYVQSGTATFELTEEPDSSTTEAVTVEAGEVIRIPPGTFQEGYNDADNDEPVEGFALGAPASRHDWDALESVMHCSACGEETAQATTLTDDGSFRFTCGDCGTTVTF